MAVDTQRAFDSVASEYDRSNAENTILRAMRRRTLAAVTAHVPRGGRILDLGCGPGYDAEVLAAAGYTVTAVDSSPAMVAEARRRVQGANLTGRVDVRHLAIEDLDELPEGEADAAYSDFGPLNCVPDLARASRLLANRLRPNGILVASVIGRICPWEIALYLSRGQLARARVRFARGMAPVPLNGHTVWTRYYTPREFERAFVPAGFQRVSLRALGLFVPPPYMQAFAGRHPRLIGALQRLEDLAGGWPAVRRMGDHFLVVMQKNRTV